MADCKKVIAIRMAIKIWHRTNGPLNFIPNISILSPKRSSRNVPEEEIVGSATKVELKIKIEKI